jgi:hypothetical protein
MVRKNTFLLAFILGCLKSFGAEIQAVKTPQFSYGFIENKGQVKNQYGQINQEALYVFKGNGIQVQLRRNGFSYEQIKEAGKVNYLKSNQQELAEQNVEVYRIDIDFKGAKGYIPIQEMEPRAGELIYRAKENISQSIHCKNYNRILYKNVYPQVDIEFIVSEEAGNQDFKYNIILNPGADASLVQFAIFGSNQTKINDKGNLTFETDGGVLEEQIPLSYELTHTGGQGKTIHANFVQISPSVFGFSLNQNNPNQTRIIDPLLWSTYYGGPNNEVARDLETDLNGNVFITGITTSFTNIATNGAYQTIFNGNSYDVALAKFSGNGTLLWATYFGGPETENSMGIDVNDAGQVFICGQTLSSSGIASSGAYQTSISGAADAFLTKFGSNGNLLWSTYYGGTSTDILNAIAVDGNGMINVIGNSNSPIVFPYTGVHQTSASASSADAIILRFNDNGNLVIGSFYGGGSTEQGLEIDVDAHNNIYITGYTSSTTGIATTAAYQSALAGNADAYIAKFDTNLVLKYATYFGGSSWDYPQDIKIDSHGNMDVSGYTYSSTDFPLLNAFQSTFNTVSNKAFLFQLDSLGTLKFSTYFGGEILNQVYGMDIDGSDNIYIGGVTNSVTGIASASAYQLELRNTGFDAFLASFTSYGGLLWSTYFGGENADYGRGIAIDKFNNLFFLGDTYSDSFISVGTVHQSSNMGGDEIFLFKMSLGTSTQALANNTIGSNQTLCGTSVAADLIGSTPTGGTGSYSYTWLQSATGLDGSFVNANGSNTNKDYSPGSISSQTYYKRVVTDGSAFDTSNVVIIKIGSTFKAGFTVNKTIQCLRSNQFIFTDTTSASGLTYDWDFGNGATSTNQSETISYAYQAANVYRVRLITSFGGSCADTNYKNVYTVTDPIAKNITGIDQVRRLDTASYFIPHTAGSRYVWVFDNGQLKGNGTGNQIQIKWTAVGTTQLKVVETSSGNCLGDTAFLDITISPALDIEELTNENTFQVYPNPNTGSFVIGGLNQKEFTVNVYDARGALVKTQVIQGETRIELENASAGLYVIQLIHPNGNVYQKRMQIAAE